MEAISLDKIIRKTVKEYRKQSGVFTLRLKIAVAVAMLIGAAAIAITTIQLEED